LSQVTKAVLERALAEEMTGHLGYDKHDPAGRGRGNNRNGTTGKTVLTDIGAVDLAVPCDRNGKALAATDADRAERIANSLTDGPRKVWALIGIARTLAATSS
jgi:putative transposase